MRGRNYSLRITLRADATILGLSSATLPQLARPHQETGLSNLAGAVGCGINSTVVAGLATVQFHLEANGLTVFHRTPCVGRDREPEHNLARRCLKHSALGTDVPRSAQSPLIQRGCRRWAVGLSRRRRKSQCRSRYVRRGETGQAPSLRFVSEKIAGRMIVRPAASDAEIYGLQDGGFVLRFGLVHSGPSLV